MAPPVKNVYAGGYSEAARRQLERAVIPDKVKCVSCKKLRMQSMFSKRQLSHMQHAVAQGLRSAAVSRCRSCVGGQTVELKCCICDKVKGLDEFARSQRQNHETARCLNCTQTVTESDLLDDQRLIPESELTTQDSALTRSHVDDDSLTESTQRLNLNSPYAASGVSALDDDDIHSLGGGVWVETRSQEDNENDENDENENEFQVVTSAGKGKGKGRARSGALDRNRNRDGDLETPRAMPPPFTQKKVSKFAKVPGRRVEKSDMPSMRVPESTGEHIPSDDEAEDHSVEEYL